MLTDTDTYNPFEKGGVNNRESEMSKEDLLEFKIKTLSDDVKRLAGELEQERNLNRDVRNKLDRAEGWGRGAIYASLAVGGIILKGEDIAKAINKWLS